MGLNNRKCRNWKRWCGMGLALSMLVTLMPGNIGSRHASAADAADLRIVYTTDLHGQLTTVDYETGGMYNTGSLAKAATLINQAKSEVKAGNTLVFDLGDTLYDYTTDYIYGYDDSSIQPMYSAMASIGYDAITLGNHDFDYTLDYIKGQLSSTGLTDKVVLSNVKDANTGASIWAENKIIEKTLTTDSGASVTVKVGLIGETVPDLSKKRTNYTGVLKTEDIVANTQREAADLKAQGADIVVVMAHSGIGVENPESMDTNTGYALTKIPEVDVVLCGHKHTFFSADGTTEYDKLPGVDTSTGLVNGKNLVQVENRGDGVGVVDLSISNATGANQIISRKSAIKKATVDTVADANINNNYMGAWSRIFLSDCTEILNDISAGTRLENYFGTMEDSGAIQLLNDIKISYGLNYINNTDSQYKGLPVVGASTYIKYGAEDGEDYVDISGSFARSNMYDLINYKTGLYLYKVTGSQLREWLEWSSSAYEKPGRNVVVAPTSSPEPTTGAAVTATPEASEGTSPAAVGVAKKASSLSAKKTAKVNEIEDVLEGILNYKGSEPLQYMLQETWLNDWSNFYVFDGIEYSIDASQAPRYDANGNKLADTHRVTSLTRNGVAIADTDQLIVVGHRLPSNSVTDPISAQKLDSTSTENYRNYIEDYISKSSMDGAMKNTEDHNWDVSTSADYQYIMKSGEASSNLTAARAWIQEVLDTKDGFNYYRADFAKQDKTDVTGPNIEAVSLNEVETNNDVQVAVQANDRSGINSLSVLTGKYGMHNSVWDTAKAITDGYITCKENSIYSIRAIDNRGNISMKYVRINNINKSILEAPRVDSYTNRMKKINGKAEPDATIYFELASGTVYKSTVKSTGKFSYALPPQKAGSKVYVYVIDSKKRASARTVVTVKRTGPNKPTLSSVKTNSRLVKGNINDSYTYPVIIVNKKTIYIPKDGTYDLYKNSVLNSSSYKVVMVDGVSVTSSGSFAFTLPSLLKKGVTVDVKTLDASSRASLQTRVTVKQAVPAKAITDPVSNLTRKVKIYSEEKCTSAILKVGKKKYTNKKPKYISSKKMYRYTVSIPRTDSNVAMKAYLTNVKGKSSALKIAITEKVPNKPKLDKVKANVKKITGQIDLVGSKTEENTVATTKTKVYVYVSGKKYKAKVDNEGVFYVKVKKVSSGTVIKCKAKNRYGTSLVRTVTVK